MSNSYNVGDIVKLKSGGPNMTIKTVHVSYEEFQGTYQCQWFAGKKLDTGAFPEESLVAVTEEE
jgi:uncharacterized protein YodC (DUF2158 family)